MSPVRALKPTDQCDQIGTFLLHLAGILCSKNGANLPTLQLTPFFPFPGDLFPDSLAHREILQLFVRCPNARRGCASVMHLSDVDSHAAVCGHRDKEDEGKAGGER